MTLALVRELTLALEVRELMLALGVLALVLKSALVMVMVLWLDLRAP